MFKYHLKLHQIQRKEQASKQNSSTGEDKLDNHQAQVLVQKKALSLQSKSLIMEKEIRNSLIASCLIQAGKIMKGTI